MAATLWPAEKAPVKKSAFDKATLEAYVRHLFVWGPAIKVALGDPAGNCSPKLQYGTYGIRNSSIASCAVFPPGSQSR